MKKIKLFDILVTKFAETQVSQAAFNLNGHKPGLEMPVFVGFGISNGVLTLSFLGENLMGELEHTTLEFNIDRLDLHIS